MVLQPGLQCQLQDIPPWSLERVKVATIGALAAILGNFFCQLSPVPQLLILIVFDPTGHGQLGSGSGSGSASDWEVMTRPSCHLFLGSGG